MWERTEWLDNDDANTFDEKRITHWNKDEVIDAMFVVKLVVPFQEGIMKRVFV